jgi:hypothetical protein
MSQLPELKLSFISWIRIFELHYQKGLAIKHALENWPEPTEGGKRKIKEIHGWN